VPVEKPYHMFISITAANLRVVFSHDSVDILRSCDSLKLNMVWWAAGLVTAVAVNWLSHSWVEAGKADIWQEVGWVYGHVRITAL